jgi:hypothetical protein
MLVKSFGCAIQGISATTITIEVNVDQGIQFSMVGLPDNAVRESHQRIEAALINIGYKIPHKKVTINMAPADIRKEDLHTIFLSQLEYWRLLNSCKPGCSKNISSWVNCRSMAVCNRSGGITHCNRSP